MEGLSRQGHFSAPERWPRVLLALLQLVIETVAAKLRLPDNMGHKTGGQKGDWRHISALYGQPGEGAIAQCDLESSRCLKLTTNEDRDVKTTEIGSFPVWGQQFPAKGSV